MKGIARPLFLIYTFAIAFGKYPPNKNEIILVDGYWQKHLGTESALGTDGDWFTKVCSVLPKPDITVLLDIDPRIVLSRGKRPKPYECGCDFSCSDNSFILHQSKVRSILLDAAEKFGWQKVDAARTEDQVEFDIRQIFQTFMDRLITSASLKSTLSDSN
jgi:thymidylate kinase